MNFFFDTDMKIKTITNVKHAPSFFFIFYIPRKTIIIYTKSDRNANEFDLNFANLTIPRIVHDTRRLICSLAFPEVQKSPSNLL